MAELIEWLPEYSVGIKEIDEQHRTLVELINQLDEAIRSKKGSKASSQIVADLIDYTQVHFALEEELMRLMGFPDLDQHRLKHANLIDEVVALKEKMETSANSISFELMYFLRQWLTRHIMESDQQYAWHFKETGHDGSQGYQNWQNRVANHAPKRPWWKFW